MNGNRITSIDSLKVLLYFFVICIHVTSWEYKSFVLPVSRIAVPIFFMISGFFIDIKNIDVLRKHAIKMFYSFLIVVLAHITIFFFINYIIYNRGFVDSLLISPLNGEKLLSIQGIINLILFNEVTLMPHLWYLTTYIYALITLSLLTKVKNKYLFCITCLLLLIARIISISCPELDSFYYRNFLFLGVPYILIGYFIRSINYERMKNSYLLLLTFIFVSMTYCESFILNSTYSALFLSIIVFILTVRNANVNPFSRLSKFISVNGLYVYNYHYIVIVGIGIIMSKLEHIEWIYNINRHLNPFIVYFTTICIIYFYKSVFLCHLNKFRSQVKKYY